MKSKRFVVMVLGAFVGGTVANYGSLWVGMLIFGVSVACSWVVWP